VFLVVLLGTCVSARVSVAEGEDWSQLGIEAPPPPVPPETVARDASGRATVRAVRLNAPLHVDGILDEAVYRTTQPITGFIQQEPQEGAPATEDTEAWVFFDDDNVYVSARCWDSHPERIVANEMRRDHRNLWQNDNFGVALDTFFDRRNGFFFYVTPAGGIHDSLITDESTFNSDWNTVAKLEAARFEQGWTVEIAIPFKSLRYGSSPVWGINLRRRVRAKDEVSYITPVPASFGGRGIAKLSSAGVLVGLEPPRGSSNLEVKPYAIGGLSTDLDADPAFADDLDGDLGVDLKYGLTQSLTLDATYNTDFAQVEADEQQVNLTRFSLFFPEKREFFLEGRDLFSFGSPPNHGGSAQPIVFFSRRIGLSEDATPIPISAGLRLTGKAGPYGVGALHIRQRDDPAGVTPQTDFTVVRVKRDVLRRSTVGVIATRRGPSLEDGGSNQVFGVDAGFSFFDDLSFDGYYVESRTPGRSGGEASHMLRGDYSGDRYGLRFQRLAVEEGFNPEIGFVPREDFVRHNGEARFSPRPASIDAIRKLHFQVELDHITDGRGWLETRTAEASFGIDLESSDRFRVEYQDNFERLDEAFEIIDELFIPPGDYSFGEWSLRFELGQQRPVSGHFVLGTGSFYSGTRTRVRFNGRIDLAHRLSVEPRIGFNWVDLAEGSFTTELIGGRVSFAFTPRAFVSALIQYSSTSQELSTNLRLRWEYSPGSEVFFVYSDGRATEVTGFPSVRNRSVVLKLTRLIRF